MWYILILFFVGIFFIFFWNIYVKEYDDDDCEIEMIKDI